MARPRVVLDDDAWAAVRVAYEDTPEPVTRILARFGIQRHQLYDRIALENWRMRSSGVGQVGRGRSTAGCTTATVAAGRACDQRSGD